MQSPLLSLTLALCASAIPVAAVAQVTHHSLDPVDRTQGCQSAVTAYHNNGDVVRADYHGQWQDVGVHQIQNAGHKGASCALERIARISPEGEVQWELFASEHSDGQGIRRQDKVSSLVALPSGDTVISYEGAASETGSEQSVTIARLDRAGNARWRFRNTKQVQASLSDVHVGAAGEIFVNYSITNFAIRNGEFQLPGGRVWRLRKNALISLLVRLDPETGRLLWERKGLALVSTQDGELLALTSQLKKRPIRSMRLVMQRLDYQGRVKSKARTPWLRRERLVSAIRFDGALAVTTNLEVVNEDLQQVQHRYNRFRIFSLKGKPLRTQDVSDESVLATSQPGSPLRLLSPTECHKKDYRCLTSRVEVLTMQDRHSTPKYSAISFGDSKLDSRLLLGQSLTDGLWVSGVSYTGQKLAPGTMVHFSPNAARRAMPHHPKQIWRPSGAKTTSVDVGQGF